MFSAIRSRKLIQIGSTNYGAHMEEDGAAADAAGLALARAWVALI